MNRFKGDGDDLNKEIWNSEMYNNETKNITNRLYFMQYRLEDMRETAVINNNLQKFTTNQNQTSEFKNAYRNFNEAFAKIQKLQNTKKYEIAVQRILTSFLASVIPFDVWNINGINSEILIGDTIIRMVTEFKINLVKINKLLTVSARSIDKSIKKIEFRFVENPKILENLVFPNGVPTNINQVNQPNGKFWKLTAKLNNGKEIPLNLLSSGVLNFVYQFCLIYFAYINVPKEVHKYILIDELGSNWHSYLSQQFINIFNHNILENCTLVFTSHNPLLADNLRNDSVYIINNERQLMRLSDTSIRNSEKFSNKYSNVNIDWFDTDPLIEDFDDLIDFFDNVDE